MERWDRIAELIREHIAHKEPFRFVEVGVSDGDTAIRLIEWFPAMTYIGVDCYDVRHDSFHLAEGLDPDDPGVRADFQTAHDRILQTLAPHRNASILFLPSQEAARLFRDGSIDGLFLDADHQQMSVKEDLQAWWPVVRRLYCGHDYATQNPDGTGSVKAALEEWDDEMQLQHRIHEEADVWHYVKPEVLPDGR